MCVCVCVSVLQYGSGAGTYHIIPNYLIHLKCLFHLFSLSSLSHISYPSYLSHISYLSIYLSVCLSIYLSIQLPIYPSIYQSIYLVTICNYGNLPLNISNLPFAILQPVACTRNMMPCENLCLFSRYGTDNSTCKSTLQHDSWQVSA